MRGDPRRGPSTGLRGAGAGSAPVRAPEVLSYLRHNPVQELLAEVYGVWQSTVHGSSRTSRTWRVLHTGRRRPLGAFPVTITAVLGLINTHTP